MAGFFQAELILSVLLTLYSLQDVCAVISVGETEKGFLFGTCRLSSSHLKGGQ